MPRGEGKTKAFWRECYDCEYMFDVSISKNKTRKTWKKCPICGHSIAYLESSSIRWLNHTFTDNKYPHGQESYGIAWGVE